MVQNAMIFSLFILDRKTERERERNEIYIEHCTVFYGCILHTIEVAYKIFNYKLIHMFCLPMVYLNKKLNKIII